MKLKGLLCAFVLILLAGCMHLPNYTYAPFMQETVASGQEKAAGIGDIFFDYSEGQTVTEPTYLPNGTPSSGSRFALTVVELNKERLGLQYNEFTYQPQLQYIGTMPILGVGNWMVKEGFNKRFDYAVADRVVRFKGYEFEILSVENGQIKYRRIK